MVLEDVFRDCINKLIEEAKGLDLTNPEVYKAWLAQTYFFTSHSMETLNYIANNTKNEDQKKRWQKHATEESGHENLALSDLKLMGGSIHNYREYPETAMLYQSQYYLCAKNSPDACFGWILALEGLAALIDKDYIDEVVSAHGPSRCRFIKLHAEEDPEHLQSALKMVNELDDVDLVIMNLRRSTHFYITMLEKIKQNVHEFEQDLAA